jgi:hypothetical protein
MENKPIIRPSHKANKSDKQEKKKAYLDAIRDVKIKVDESSNSSQSLREVCRKVSEPYGIDPETLRSKYRRAEENESGHHGNQRFSDEEEAWLVGLLRALSTLNAASTQSSFIVATRKIMNLPESWDGWAWLKGFLARHNHELKLRTGQGLTKDRNMRRIPAEVDNFCQILEILHSHFTFRPEATFAADEVSLGFTQGDIGAKRIVAFEQEQANILFKAHYHYSSAFPFFSASNSVIALFIFVKAVPGTGPVKLNIPETPDRLRSDFPVYFVFTETGRNNQEAFSAIMKVFTERVNLLWPDQPKLLYLDRHCHMEERTILEAMKSNLHTAFLAPNTSFFAQVGDSTPNAAFKRDLRRSIENDLPSYSLRQKNPDHIALKHVYAAAKRAFTHEVIADAWEKVGLWRGGKFDGDYIRQRARTWSGSEAPEALDPVVQMSTEYFMELHEEIQPAVPTKKVTTRPKPNIVYTGDQVKENSKLREEEEKRLSQEKEFSKKRRNEEKEAKESRKASRKEKKKINRCQICQKKWTNQKNWMLCEHCDEFSICKSCWKQDASKAIMEDHESNCMSK